MSRSARLVFSPVSSQPDAGGSAIVRRIAEKADSIGSGMRGREELLAAWKLSGVRQAQAIDLASALGIKVPFPLKVLRLAGESFQNAGPLGRR